MFVGESKSMLRLIPESIPIYCVVIEYENEGGASLSSAYFVFDGQVKFIPRLSSLLSILVENNPSEVNTRERFDNDLRSDRTAHDIRIEFDAEYPYWDLDSEGPVVSSIADALWEARLGTYDSTGMIGDSWEIYMRVNDVDRAVELLKSKLREFDMLKEATIFNGNEIIWKSGDAK